MPDEYIKRSDALQHFENYTPGWSVVKEDVINGLKEIPAADVAEVRHGRWVQSDLDKDFVTCSECKRMKLQNRMAWNLNTAEHWGLHYCPNCGAKMSGPEGDEMERARKLAEEKEKHDGST